MPDDERTPPVRSTRRRRQAPLPKRAGSGAVAARHGRRQRPCLRPGVYPHRTPGRCRAGRSGARGRRAPRPPPSAPRAQPSAELTATRAPTILPAMMASAAYSGVCEAVLIAAATAENAARHSQPAGPYPLRLVIIYNANQGQVGRSPRQEGRMCTMERDDKLAGKARGVIQDGLKVPLWFRGPNRVRKQEPQEGGGRSCRRTGS